MKKQEFYWTYRTPDTPELSDLPSGTFSGTEKQWESLTPGMRREIYRQALKVYNAKKNPRAKRRARVGSFRDRYVKAEQMERLARHYGRKKLENDAKFIKSGLVIRRVKTNPSHINRRKPKVSTKFYLIEGLVRESAHSRKFDYRYYTGTGFTNDRNRGFIFSTKSAAETGMRKIINSLPKEILQIRAIAK